MTLEWRYHDSYGAWSSFISLSGVPVFRLWVYDGPLGEVSACVCAYAEMHEEEVAAYDTCDDVKEGKRIAIELARVIVRELAKELEVE